MAAAIDEHNPILGAHQARNLITPITAVAEAAMQHDHDAPGPKCRVPDSCAIMVHVALIAPGRQWSGAMPFVDGRFALVQLTRQLAHEL
jgi:hypothetical protein